VISIRIDKRLPGLERAERALRDATLAHAAGGAVARLLQDHFRARNSRGNRLGGARTNYWASAAKAVSWKADSSGATVTVSHIGIGHHYHGGTIKPVNSKYLTIPAVAKAHGRRAREFGNLTAVIFRKGRLGALIEKSGQKGEESKVIYWLVAKATKQPDPSVLPPEAQITQTALEAIRRQIQSYKT
jgi:hypothetical protein